MPTSQAKYIFCKIFSVGFFPGKVFLSIGSVHYSVSKFLGNATGAAILGDLEAYVATTMLHHPEPLKERVEPSTFFSA